jgi:quercetin dioxygenase-like cupin family protein
MSKPIKTLFLTFIFCSNAYALEPGLLNSSDLKWSGNSSEVRIASISGNEKSTGMYIYRVKFPKGHKIMPHFHSDERVVTVISGSLYVGYGNSFNPEEMKNLQEGGIYTEPKEQAHYVWAKDGEVELQVIGYGPSIRTSVN